jgi:licheninase
MRLTTIGGVVALVLLAGAPPALAAPAPPPADCAPVPASSGVVPALLGALVPVPAPPAPCAAEPEESAGHATSVAALHGWGEPVRVEEFGGDALGEPWNVYDGPGHAGNGRRTPEAVSLRDGIMTITGDSRGSTAGMGWGSGQHYGRWEGRVKAPASDESYNALLLLWPDAEDFPVGGEIDFMEMMDHTRQETHVFLHYGEDNDQISGSVKADATQWNNWAVEWTPTHIATFVNGQEWWRTERVEIFPPRRMHLCIQLDWFPNEGRGAVQESTMQVDWVKQYALGPTKLAGSTVADAARVVDAVGAGFSGIP